jgi:RHS repeat-associated protein
MPTFTTYNSTGVVSRSVSSEAYRFGFQGQEKDPEWTGQQGSHYTAAFWEYDTRIGRRWNVDPVSYPWQSPYATFNDNPVLYIDPDGDEPIDPRTGKQIKLNLYRAAIYDRYYLDSKDAKLQKLRDVDLYKHAKRFPKRSRGMPDGAWSGAYYDRHETVWEHFDKDSKNAMRSLFPNQENRNTVFGDYGSPNDRIWMDAASNGSYIFVDDKYAETEYYRFFTPLKEEFNIMNVEENYITRIVNFKKSESKNTYSINSVTEFDIEKSEIKERNVKTWWGGNKIERYRTLNVTETTTYYKDGKETSNVSTKTYQKEQTID